MKINKYTKLIIFTGLALIVCAMTACAVTAILAGKTGNYYRLMSYSQDFAILSRQYIGITVLGSVITQIIYPHQKDNKTE